MRRITSLMTKMLLIVFILLLIGNLQVELKKMDRRVSNANPTSDPKGFVPVYLTYSKMEAYCPPENAEAIKAIDAKMLAGSFQYASDHKKCIDIYHDDDQCNTSCGLQLVIGSKECKLKKDDSCLFEIADKYRGCILRCPSISTDCEYVYNEQKQLGYQFSELCR